MNLSTLPSIDHAHILSIDPGGTTGIACQFAARHDQRLITTTTVDTPEALYDIVLEYKWDAVLCERFSTAGRLSKYGIYTIQLVGGVHALCHVNGLPFIYRQPQNRKAFQDVARAWFAGAKHMPHQEDALAHLFSWKDVQRKAMEAAVEATVE